MFRTELLKNTQHTQHILPIQFPIYRYDIVCSPFWLPIFCSFVPLYRIEGYNFRLINRLIATLLFIILSLTVAASLSRIILYCGTPGRVWIYVCTFCAYKNTVGVWSNVDLSTTTYCIFIRVNAYTWLLGLDCGSSKEIQNCVLTASIALNLGHILHHHTTNQAVLFISSITTSIVINSGITDSNRILSWAL